ncbi:hypothetical protein ACET3Z_031518 [Daucus carota]
MILEEDAVKPMSNHYICGFLVKDNSQIIDSQGAGSHVFVIHSLRRPLIPTWTITVNHYDPTTNSFNFTDEEWEQHAKGNKIIDTLKTTPLSYPDLCTHLFDGTAATGVSGWGPSSKRSRTIDLNDDIENLGTEEVQSNNANPNDVEIPKKKG